jgi:AraC-like DNA-binding protein
MTAGANPLAAHARMPVQGLLPSPVVQFRAWVDAFERLGYDVRTLLTDVGLERASLADPDLLIPCDVVGAFFARSQQVRPLKNLWTKLGAETPLGAIPLLDYLIITSDTVGEGLEQEARYFRLVGAPFVLDIQRDEDPVRLVYRINSPMLSRSIEYSALLNLQGLRGETDNRVRFAYVSFMHEPDDVSEIERLLGCDVRVNASWAGIAIPRESWQLPLKRRDPILRRLLERHADATGPSEPTSDTLTLDVRRALTKRLARGEADMDLVARDLAMSARTLQRKLAASGSSFHALLDCARRETAERWIVDRTLSIAEVAYLAGYSEAAAFHRAFKRWTGVTPQAYRQGERRKAFPSVSASK